MRRIVVSFIVCGLFFTSYLSFFNEGLGSVDKINASTGESLFASYSTKKFTNPAKNRDAARAVYGEDGKVFSRMFDNMSDGYKVKGKVWVQTSSVYYSSGTTKGLHQGLSPIFVAKDSRKLKRDYAGYTYCEFVK